jgi:uncharacterized repeat protein (TIGR03803 family)
LRQVMRLASGWLAFGLAALGVAGAQMAPVTETVLHSFPANSPQGAVPLAGLVEDPAGNLYGTTSRGGIWNWGVVFKVDTSGHETVLYNFTGGADGGNPNAVILDSAGNLYGTATSGGSANWGVVFKLDPACHEKVLYNFTGGVDGAYPSAGVIRDPAGNLYGTTEYGGTNAGYAGGGVVYRLDTAGHQKVVHTFMGADDGFNPQAGVVRDSAGEDDLVNWGRSGLVGVIPPTSSLG